MIRFSSWMILTALVVLGLWMPSCDARAGGGRGGGRGGGFGGGFGEEVEVPPVEWSPNIPDAEESSKKDDKPYLVYFCTEDVAKYAGLGTEALKEYRKTNKITTAYTPFEDYKFIDMLKSHGYSVVKVVASPQTIAVAKKYKVTATPALVACSPTGDVLAQLQGDQCTQTNMTNMIKGLKDIHEKWKKASEAKEAAKAKDAEKPGEGVAANPPANNPPAANPPAANPPAQKGDDGP